MIHTTPRRSNNKRAAMLPLPAAQALSQLLQQLFTLVLGNTRKSGHGIRQQPDLRWFQGPGQEPVALAIVLILRDVTAYSPQFVQGGIHRPPVAPKAVLCPQETKQVPPWSGRGLRRCIQKESDRRGRAEDSQQNPLVQPHRNTVRIGQGEPVGHIIQSTAPVASGPSNPAGVKAQPQNHVVL